MVKKWFRFHWSDNCMNFVGGYRIKKGDMGLLGMPFFNVKAESSEEAVFKLRARVDEVLPGEDVGVKEKGKVCTNRGTYYRIVKVANGKDIVIG